MGRITPGVALGLFLATWVFAFTVVLLLARTRGGVAQLRHASRGWWGMVVAHLGVGLFIVGVTMVRGYESERDVRMSPGDHVEVAGLRFTMQGLDDVKGPNYVAVRGRFEVQGDGAVPFIMHPEKRLYKVQTMPMTEAAIDVGLTRDVYVSLGEALDDKTWTVRIHHKPFVDWIWGGAFVMALGGLLAWTDRRYRVKSTAPMRDPVGAADAAPATQPSGAA